MIEAKGFALDRKSDGVRFYNGTVGGRVRLVSVHSRRGGDDVKTGTLQSMIRASGHDSRLGP